ncbi:hypothetical protein SAMN05192553_101795 [Cyclobacterium xiamenense]|uniref:Uncharacterized protein n=1 Tax=Cyclobacterium xiamenense TaxID=1297121 RepID=A0A1H6UEF8_9BACT|nr:hypothetical protein SAMN05192553_101795 [Cyclobacterium xiamenense]
MMFFVITLPLLLSASERFNLDSSFFPIPMIGRFHSVFSKGIYFTDTGFILPAYKLIGSIFYSLSPFLLYAFLKLAINNNK